MATRAHIASTTANYDSREAPYQLMQRGGYKGSVLKETIYVKQPNPIADTANWETGGRESPMSAISPMMMYYAVGGLLALLLIMKKKK